LPEGASVVRKTSIRPSFELRRKHEKLPSPLMLPRTAMTCHDYILESSFFVGETADSPSPSSSPWKLYIMTSLHLFLTQITLQQTNIDVYNPWFSSKNDLLKWLFLLHVRRE